MDFVGHHAITQSGVDALVALDQTLAFKLCRDQGGIPMAAVPLDLQMRTGKACSDEIL
jgi:hypothetical protein